MVGRENVKEKVGNVIGETGIVAGVEVTQGAEVEVEIARTVMKSVVKDMLAAVPVPEGVGMDLMIVPLGMSQRRRKRRRRRRMMELTIQIQRLQRQIDFVHPLV